MPSIRGRMAVGNDFFYFLFWDTATEDVVGSSPKE
jgi:hypothetical protein